MEDIICEMEPFDEKDFENFVWDNAKYDNYVHSKIKVFTSVLETSSFQCSFCDQQHSHWICSKFATAKERFKCAKRRMLCIKCLSQFHQTLECDMNFKCQKCDNMHHSL